MCGVIYFYGNQEYPHGMYRYVLYISVRHRASGTCNLACIDGATKDVIPHYWLHALQALHAGSVKEERP